MPCHTIVTSLPNQITRARVTFFILVTMAGRWTKGESYFSPFVSEHLYMRTEPARESCRAAEKGAVDNDVSSTSLPTDFLLYVNGILMLERTQPGVPDTTNFDRQHYHKFHIQRNLNSYIKMSKRSVVLLVVAQRFPVHQYRLIM